MIEIPSLIKRLGPFRKIIFFGSGNITDRTCYTIIYFTHIQEETGCNGKVEEGVQISKTGEAWAGARLSEAGWEA